MSKKGLTPSKTLPGEGLVTIFLCLLLLISCEERAVYESQANEVFPPAEIKFAALFRMDQLPISPAFFRDRWTLVVFGEADCPADCQHRLSVLNQVESAQSLFVITDIADHKQLRGLAKKYPSVSVSMGTSAASFDYFYNQFDVEEISAKDKHTFVYLVDGSPALVYTLSLEDLTSRDIDWELTALK